jgi:hypothetical protein
VIASAKRQKIRGKCRKTAAPAPICGEIMPLSRGLRSIGDMPFCAVRSGYFYSKAFTTNQIGEMAGFTSN